MFNQPQPVTSPRSVAVGFIAFIVAISAFLIPLFFTMTARQSGVAHFVPYVWAIGFGFSVFAMPVGRSPVTFFFAIAGAFLGCIIITVAGYKGFPATLPLLVLTAGTAFLGYKTAKIAMEGSGYLFGSARWAKPADLKKAGLLEPGGLFLGSLNGHDIFQHGEDSVITVAPQGSGKSSSLVVPTLLTYPGSVIVTDPKSELVQMTANARRKMGQRVIVLNPFRSQLLAETGHDFGDDGFNPLSFIQDGPMNKAARTLADVLMPPDPRDDGFFAPAARDVLNGLFYFVLTQCTGRERSIPYARTLLSLPPPAFRSMLENDWLTANDPALIENAGKILGHMESSGQWGGVKSTVHNALTIYEGELAEHMSRGDLSPDLFKREAVTVYIILPADASDAHGAWFRLVASTLCRAVGRPGPRREVLFLCDEFANLGRADDIAKSVSIYRAAGLKAWFLIQYQQQLVDLYGNHGPDKFFALCTVKQFFKVTDYKLQEYISRASGKTTALNPSFDPQDQTKSVGQTGVPLISADEVRLLKPNEQIIFYGELPVIKAKLVSYRERPAWNQRAGQNSYHSKPGTIRQTTQQTKLGNISPGFTRFISDREPSLIYSIAVGIAAFAVLTFAVVVYGVYIAQDVQLPPNPALSVVRVSIAGAIFGTGYWLVRRFLASRS